MKKVIAIVALVLLLAGLGSAVQIMPNTQVLGQNTDGELIQIYAFPVTMFAMGTGFDNPVTVVYDKNGNPVLAIGLVGKNAGS
jgi:hypothetical protein